MTHDLVSLLGQYGLALVFANVLIEQIGLPVPALPTLVVAGSVHELYRLIDTGAKPVIVDVRSPTGRALDPRRIPGALHVPLHAVDHHVKDLPRDREIILYCTCPNEASAAQVAKILMNAGFEKVRPLHGGLDAWIAAGYEVEELSAADTTAIVSVASGAGGTQRQA